MIVYSLKLNNPYSFLIGERHDVNGDTCFVSIGCWEGIDVTKGHFSSADSLGDTFSVG